MRPKSFHKNSVIFDIFGMTNSVIFDIFGTTNCAILSFLGILYTFWRISLSSKHFFHNFFTYITFTIHIIDHLGYFFHIFNLSLQIYGDFHKSFHNLTKFFREHARGARALFHLCSDQTDSTILSKSGPYFSNFNLGTDLQKVQESSFESKM